MNSENKALCDLGTIQLMQNDCETIKEILLGVRHPVFSMAIIPYAALFCRSFQEYCNDTLIDEDTDQEIDDIRNSLKLYTRKYGKAKKEVSRADLEQDKEFREMLRFRILEKLNIHYNLGLYFDQNYNLVSNTQLIAYSLNIKNLGDKQSKEKAYQLGHNIGKIVGSVSTGLAQVLPPGGTTLESKEIQMYYCDIKTNINGFFLPEYEKDMSLVLLHMLCNMNFVKYMIGQILPHDNLWVFRLKYITMHNVWQGLTRLKAHVDNTESVDLVLSQKLSSVTEDLNRMFPSDFRNCMMHYDMKNAGEMQIKEEFFNLDKPLYGLVESCFDGLSFEVYAEKIDTYQNSVECFLKGMFDFSKLTFTEL